jgi:cytochrome c oxidase subunit 2
MPSDLDVMPERGSDIAARVDTLFYFVLAVSAFFSLLIAGLIFYFGVKYRRRSPDEVGLTDKAPASLEVLWSIVPLGFVLLFFGWGADVYFAIFRPPADAVQYFAVGRQWMWKFQHPDGRSEINDLHVPVGQAVKLTMTSEDVIHSFYVPEFRVKSDVVPGRYTTIWFRASAPGTYRLFCAEYCGGEHSKMIGRVIAMDPSRYEAWLSGGRTGMSAVASGEALFNSKGCPTCHRPDTAARAPILAGLFGKTVELQGGATVTADEGYFRESILEPAAKVVAGYQPVMPTYKGQLNEDEIIQILMYIRSQRGPSAAAGDVHGLAPLDAGPMPEPNAEPDAATNIEKDGRDDAGAGRRP